MNDEIKLDMITYSLFENYSSPIPSSGIHVKLNFFNLVELSLILGYLKILILQNKY